jgi:hypothetical protein
MSPLVESVIVYRDRGADRIEVIDAPRSAIDRPL